MLTPHEKVANLLEKCLCVIQQHASQVSQASEGRFRAAEYLLAEAREYVDAAWDLLEAGKSRASLAVSRWVLEAALNLLWAAVEPKEVDDRLRQLVKEAVCLDANCSDGLAVLFPADKACFVQQATRARAQVAASFEQVKKLERLWERVKSLIDSLNGSAGSATIPNPYALYSVCCDAAHPGLSIWQRFGLNSDGATVSSSPRDSTCQRRSESARIQPV